MGALASKDIELSIDKHLFSIHVKVKLKLAESKSILKELFKNDLG